MLIVSYLSLGNTGNNVVAFDRHNIASYDAFSKQSFVINNETIISTNESTIEYIVSSEHLSLGNTANNVSALAIVTLSATMSTQSNNSYSTTKQATVSMTNSNNGSTRNKYHYH